MVLIVLCVVLIARYNYDLSTVIIRTNAVTMSILRIFSNLFVWIIGIVITLIGGEGNAELNMEYLDLEVNLVKSGAFVVGSVGLLVYNGVVGRRS